MYLVSVLPGVAVWLIGGHAPTPPDVPRLVLATLAVVLIQHAINLFNDAKDWTLGADVEKHDSWIRVHAERPVIALAHGTASLLAGASLGLWVLAEGGQWWVLWFALPLVLLGLAYNAGPRPLSYTAWGEWITGLCYGGVFAGLWFAAGLPPAPLPLSAGVIAFGSLAGALLLSHQPPQIDTDRAAGKRSFAVRHGAGNARLWAKRLHLTTLIATVVAMIGFHTPHLLTLAAIMFGLLAIMAVGCPGANPRRILISTTALFGVVTAISLLV